MSIKERNEEPSSNESEVVVKTKGWSFILQRILRPGPKLSQRVMHAAFWFFTLRIFIRILYSARIIILARLLAPDDFGLMGIALITTFLLEVFSQTGFKTALIQRKGDITDYLDTAWIIEVIRGIVLGGALYLAAPLAGRFFDEPAATSIIQVMSLTVVVRGFRSIGIVYFEKDLELQKRFIFETARRLVEIAVAIGLAFALRSVWALVYGVLAGAVAGVLVSYMIHPYRPKLRIDLGKAKELYSFGMWVFGNTILTYSLARMPDIAVGRLVDVTALGFYRMAHNLSMLMGSEIVGLATQVAFPAYSKIQDQKDALRSAYLQTIQVVGLAVFPVAAVMFVLAPFVVKVFLGDEWMSIVPILQVLAILGPIRSLNAIVQPLFRAVGRPDVPTKLHLATLVLMAALIYPLTTSWGQVGAAITVLVSNALVYPVAVWLSIRLIEGSSLSYLKVLSVPAIASVVVGAVVYYSYTAVNSEFNLLNLVWLSALSLIVYVSLVLLLDKIFKIGLLGMIRHRLSMA